jgi:urea carboxylase-associated protein 2
MAGTVVEAMPQLPPAARDLPAGIYPQDLLWEETIAAGGYATRRLARGSRLRLVDLAGDACASLLIYNAEMPSERLNVADTVKVQWNAYLGAGKLLLSDMGRVLMSNITDAAGTHDAFCGTSNAATNEAKYGEGSNSGAFPNGRDRLLLGAAKHGLQRRDVHPCVNLFKGTRIEADGTITPLVGPYDAGRKVAGDRRHQRHRFHDRAGHCPGVVARRHGIGEHRGHAAAPSLSSPSSCSGGSSAVVVTSCS